MKIKSFLDADSPLVDRRLRISDDEDLDGADLLGDSGAGSAGLSLEDEDDERDDLQGNDDEEGGQEEVEAQKRVADAQAKMHEATQALSRRNAEFSELQRELSEIRESLKAGSSDDDEELVRKYSDDLISEITGLSEDDPDRVKKVYTAIAKQTARVKKEVLDAIRKERAEEAQSAESRKAAREDAEKRADVALQEAFSDSGLSYKKEAHLKMFQGEVDQLIRDNPLWFQAIPAQDQFLRLANKVLSKVKRNKEQSAEHRKGAGGQLSGRSNINRSVHDDEGGDVPETMIGAMKSHAVQRRKAGAVRAAMVGRK